MRPIVSPEPLAHRVSFFLCRNGDGIIIARNLLEDLLHLPVVYNNNERGRAGSLYYPYVVSYLMALVFAVYYLIAR